MGGDTISVKYNIKIKERGAVPRKLRKVYTRGSKVAWFEAGKHFHADMRDERFTEEHARKARYVKRSDKYTRYKEKKFGHRNPLEFSGQTRRLVRTSRISSTSKGSKVRYPGARKFNFRNPNSPIHMQKEFRRLTADEKRRLAKEYDEVLNREMNADNTTTTRTL